MLRSIGREGEITVFGQSPGTDLASDRWKVNLLSTAPYIFAEINIGRWTLTPGFRFEPTVIDGSLRLPHTYQAPDIGYRRMDLALNPYFGPLAWTPNPRLSAAFRALFAGLRPDHTIPNCPVGPVRPVRSRNRSNRFP